MGARKPTIVSPVLSEIFNSQKTGTFVPSLSLDGSPSLGEVISKTNVNAL